MYPMYMLLLSTSPIFTRFTLWSAIFQIQAILRQGHRTTPKWPWRQEGYVCPIYILLVCTSPKFYSASLYNKPVLKYKAFSDKWTEWPQIDLEPYKVKLSYIWIKTVCGSQISTRFAQRPGIFELRAIFEISAPNDPKITWRLQDQI